MLQAMLKRSQVRRIYLDKQGYDKATGIYWGAGLPIYFIWIGDQHLATRAANLLDARRILADMLGKLLIQTAFAANFG